MSARAAPPGAPRVVAVPGTLCTPRLFQPLAHRMRGAVRMSAYDWMTRPGPWDIPSVADALLREITARTRPGDGPVVLAGHSTGGAIALRAAIRAADDSGYDEGYDGPPIAGLLIINSGANTAGHGDIDAHIDVFRTDKRRGWRAVRDRSFGRPAPGRDPRRLARTLFAPPAPRLRLEMEAYAARVHAAAVVEVLTSQRDLDLAPRLATITAPVTVVHGTRDTARTPAHARAIAGGVPGGEIRWAATGHTPMVEDPRATADALHSLLARL